MKIVANHHIIDISTPHVMGILNVTPDSFSDGGQFNKLDHALQHIEKMVTAGATFIDIGGESTRPGAQEVSVNEELDRVIPIVTAVAKYFNVWISIDTSKPEVMTAAAQAGAHLINDIRSLQLPGALEAAKKSGLAICLMHMQGTPQTMQKAPYYDNVVNDITQYFDEQIKRCLFAGIDRSQLLLDPGFGFGKTLQHNYQLLANLAEFKQFNLPLLVGMSRKGMIGQLLNVPPTQRLAGNIACAVIAALNGAKIIRVHDVKETVEAMRIVEATLSAGRES